MVSLPNGQILDQLDLVRLRLAPDEDARAALGQVLTPAPLARLMGGLIENPGANVVLLDPGAGIGMLSAAAVAALCERPDPPASIAVTAFLERKALQKELANISWETEVWIAEAPTHLIHFDGERFLGPYTER